MKEYKMAEVPKGAFNFCKFTIAGSLWLGLIFQVKLLVAICFIILVVSAILKVKRAPLIVLYSYTIDKILPSKKILLDEKAIGFAHTVGAVVSAIALIFLYFINPLIGWIITALLALLKTSGAFGFCGAAKLYTCLNNPNGQCCRGGRKLKKYSCG